MSARSGMTLLEILSVLAILVLLSVLALPALNLFRSQSILKDAARTAQSLFHEARTMAIAQGKEITVRIDPSEESIILLDGRPAESETGTPVSKKWMAPAAVEIKDVSGEESAIRQVTFKYNGGATANLSVHLKRRNDDSKYYTVTVIDTTGFANIYPRKQN